MRYLQADHWPGRVMRWPLRALPKGKVVRILRGPLLGYRWLTGVAPEGWWLGLSEQYKQKKFYKALAGKKCLYDIGANVGLYTLVAAKAMDVSGKVFAFEPSPRNFKFLQTHLKLNKITNVETLPFAVSDFDGSAYFADDGDPVASRISQDGGVAVKVCKIDSLLEQRQLPPPDCIKIDVEGVELEVLKGAEHTLRTYKPVVFVETHSRFVEGVHERCIDFLKSLGYTVEEFSSDQPPTEIIATI